MLPKLLLAVGKAGAWGRAGGGGGGQGRSPIGRYKWLRALVVYQIKVDLDTLCAQCNFAASRALRKICILGFSTVVMVVT